MKLLASVLLLFALSDAAVTPQPYVCPTLENFKDKCSCSSDTGYMYCKGVDGADWLTIFRAPSTFNLDTLVIESAKNFPRLDEIKDNIVTAKTVIFTLNEELSVPSMNLDALVRMAKEALEITYTFSGSATTKAIIIDAEHLSTKLQALSLTNVRVINLSKLKQKEMKSLRSVKLNKVSMDGPVKKVIFDIPKLTRIEITECDALEGPFQYVATDCKEEKQIEIILQNNKKLTEFDMSKMFTDKKCKFYVDLSGTKLNDDFLKTNNQLLKTITDPSQLYMVLRDVNLKCYNCVYDWYKDRKQYLHSVKCSNVNDPKYLDELKDDQVKKLPPCA